MRAGTILGHEGVGVIEALGDLVRGFEVGDRVVICSTMSCGHCSYCRAGYYAQCDTANPGGKRAGTAFFGGPEAAGGIDGLQAEKARIPFAAMTMVKLPDEVADEQAIMISDIFPTGWFGADIAEIEEGHSVVVFGSGPVGQFAIASAKLMGAGRIIAVDSKPERLAIARRQGAETINFEEEDPIETILALTGGIGVDRAIDAVGVEAEHAHYGPAAQETETGNDAEQVEKIVPDHRDTPPFAPGDAPTQALRWAVEALAKAGTLSIIGVYPPTVEAFPIGQAMNKNLTIRMGNCNHRKYVPHLIDLVRAGVIDAVALLTQEQGLSDAITAYETFDARQPGWLKVALEPAD
ncbi:zinc-binding dehydrogenase [Sphingomonas fuzhouensis]|uniref:zinc-binding dehydrogenase n=1 Tax=Sphingomonas fuzhouensis TaxID=3106033 RepID=UPI002AFE046F|nr:zinc-binding dehydrogenase [Sphingomonas sp. SGZ-02]